ncbi:glucosyl-3-phosphoglycerate synthase [Streptomyces sp. AJS327]|uniref:glucosyl-3-phosphoglycerate synthase n=1 Tax=Streptomyces sp. AJS327 TaxID=2545265 RepID=UPI002155CF7C|nr:glucosyl-3-phosphoglycerate synthase [Streptomyces sp. AJS327]
MLKTVTDNGLLGTSCPFREIDLPGGANVLDEVGSWLRCRSWTAADWPLERLLADKRRTGDTVSVVLPALNEERTVGRIASVIRGELMTGDVPLVDELVVMDSGSSDRTAEVAAAAGAKVIHRDEVLPRLPARLGKGEVLWRSLLVTEGDLVCFVDADLTSFSPAFVTGIVGPLLADPSLRLVKAMYERPLGSVPDEPTTDSSPTSPPTPSAPRSEAGAEAGSRTESGTESGIWSGAGAGAESGSGSEPGSEVGSSLAGAGEEAGVSGTASGGRDGDGQGREGSPSGGGRVTELVARPLINLHWPRLAGFVQPLGGEYAARRELLERLPFPVGYGVELGLLVDALELAGLDALAQVDVGVRHHRHQDARALGRMAAAILATAERRLGRAPRNLRLTQFDRGPSGGFAPRTWPVEAEERPPMRGIPEYRGGTGV